MPNRFSAPGEGWGTRLLERVGPPRPRDYKVHKRYPADRGDLAIGTNEWWDIDNEHKQGITGTSTTGCI